MNKPDPWGEIKVGTMKRVNASGKFDFFWAVVEKGAPALVMFPGPIDVCETLLPKLRNIDLRIRQLERPALTMALLDDSQRGIFETLCRDIVDAAEGAEEISQAVTRTIQRMRRWHLLLKGGSSQGLGLEEQRGLVAELAFLRTLTEKIGPAAAIEAWKGPEGSAKDFEFTTACVEVKARRGAAKPHVAISSVDQLSDVGEARLFLRVYDVDSAILPDGMGLGEHVAITRALFMENLLELDMLDALLDTLGYDSTEDYGARRWVLGVCRSFEVSSGFPRIVPPLAEGIGNVTYSIGLDACLKFESVQDIIEVIEGD